MMKNNVLSRSLALLLAVVMALSCVGVTAFAAETESDAAADGQIPAANTEVQATPATEDDVYAVQDDSSVSDAEVAAQTSEMPVEFAEMPTYGFVLNEVTEKTVYKAGDGTVTITPATDTEPATVELNNATLVGPGMEVQNKPTSGSVAKIPTVVTFDLPDKQTTKIILTGENHIKDFYDVINTYGVAADTTVEISGSGSLTVTNCTYFINSLGYVVFDGAKVNVTVTMGAIIAGAANKTGSGITIKNQSDLKFYVTGSGSAPIGFMAGDVNIDGSTVVVDTNGEFGIYNYFGYFSDAATFTGTKITKSTVTITASADGYAGLFCLKSGNVFIEDSNVNVTQGRNGIRVDGGDVVIQGDSSVKLTGVGDVDQDNGAGIRVDTGTITLADTAFVTMTAPKGVRTSNSVCIKGAASLEIIGAASAAFNEETKVDVTGYDSCGYTAVANANNASAEGAVAWDGTSALNSYKYFKLTPAVSAMGWSGSYDGQPHSITVTAPASGVVEYSTDGENYSADTLSYVNAGTYTVDYRVVVGRTEIASASAVVAITPVNVVVTPDAKGKTYGDADPELTYTAANLLFGETLKDITVARTAGEDAGTYTIKATQPEGANSNYSITFENAQFTIEPRSIATAKVTLGAALSYNGSAQTQTVASVTLDGKVIPAAGYTVEGNTGTEAGSYELIVKGVGNYKDQVKCTFVIAPSKDEQINVNEDGSVKIGSGSLTVEVQKDEKAPETVLNTAKAELINMLIENGSLSANELAQIADGAKLDIVLFIKDGSATISDAVKKLFADAVPNYTIGSYLDITMFKYLTVGSEKESTQLHETAQKVKISIQLPAELVSNTGRRTYYVIRIHDGQTEVLDAAYDAESKTITFETDRFSDYAIAYKDKISHHPATPTAPADGTVKSPGTGDTSNLGLMAALMVVSAAGVMVLLRRKKVQS